MQPSSLIFMGFVQQISYIAMQAAPAMPPDFWWVTAGVAGLLLLSATIDAFTAEIPDFMIFLGLLAVTATQGFAVSWEFAGEHLRWAVAAGIFLWLVNQTWFAIFHHDALGMGDAKWTMLGVVCFGLMPLVYAWGIGALLGSLFIIAARLAKRPLRHITFAPFLCVGLGVGLYWTRMRG